MIPYLERTRTYYGTLGYPAYEWAHFADIPFTAVDKPLAVSRIALITTAAPNREELGDQGPGAPYNAAAKFFEYFVPPKRDGFADHDLILMSQFLILVRRYFQILYSASW